MDVSLVILVICLAVQVFVILFFFVPAVACWVFEWFADRRREWLSQFKHPESETVGDALGAIIKRGQNRFRPYPAKKRWF